MLLHFSVLLRRSSSRFGCGENYRGASLLTWWIAFADKVLLGRPTGPRKPHGSPGSILANEAGASSQAHRETVLAFAWSCKHCGMRVGPVATHSRACALTKPGLSLTDDARRIGALLDAVLADAAHSSSETATTPRRRLRIIEGEKS